MLTLSNSGAVTVAGGTLALGTNSDTVGIVQLSSGSITGSGGVLTGSSYDVQSGSISAILGGSGALTKSTVILSDANSYTGATSVNAGTLQVDGSTNASSTVNVATAGTLSGSGTVNGNANLTGNGIINKSSGSIAGTLGVTGGNWNGNGSLTGAVTSSSGTFNIGSAANLTANGGLNVTGGAIAAGNSSSTITGNVNYTSSTSSTFQGIIAGTGNTLTMNSANTTLNLTGANTYTGATSVNAGTLSVNGSLASTVVTVHNGGILAGTGIIGGGVTFESGAQHNPGNSPGIETFAADATYNGGSVFNWDLIHNVDSLTGTRGTDFDGVNVTGGTLIIASGAISNIVANNVGGNVSDVLWSDSFWDTNHAWLVFSNNTLPSTTPGIFTIGTTFDSSSTSLSSSRGAFAWSQTGNNLFLNYNVVAVPEPGTCGFLALISFGGVWLRRRKSIKQLSRPVLGS